MAKKKKLSSSEKEFFKTIRDQLLAKQGELTDSLSSGVDDLRASDSYESADLEDVGGDSSDEETAFKLLELGSAELEQIDYALKRLKDGTFGQCEECQEPMRRERLMALPFANLCIPCKRIEERGMSGG